VFPSSRRKTRFEPKNESTKLGTPEYRFRPFHNKNKTKDKKDKLPTTISLNDERRCEDVAQLLLEDKKGDELAAAVRDLDLHRAKSIASPMPALHSRSTTVVLPLLPFRTITFLTRLLLSTLPTTVT
jgi:hypothetical protein